MGSTVPTIASTTRFLTFTTPEDFSEGQFERVSIGSDGHLYLSPRTEVLFDSGEPFLWAWARDSRGNIYVGSGNDGKVYQIDSKGNSNVFFDADELEIYALAVDKQNTIYAASSPDGKIYKVTATGKSSIYFDPADKYIWSLAMNASGELFCGHRRQRDYL